MDRKILVQLCQQVQNGDTSAFAVIYDKCYLPIFRFAYSLTLNREDAEDITEETFLRAAKKIHSFVDGDFLSWLFSITHNLFFDLVRDGKKMLPLDEEYEDSIIGTDNFENELLLDENIATVQWVMEKLDEKERELLVLKYWQELDMKKIAFIVGKSHEATRKEYSRLIAKIRNLIKIER